MRLFLFILAASACGEPTDSADNTTHVTGDAFGILIQPIHPPSQDGLFDEVDTLELVVQQQDGETTSHTLRTTSTINQPTTDTIPPLDQATLTLVGSTDSRIVFHGRTPPLTITEGEHEIPIFVARDGEAAQLNPLPTPTGFSPLVATGNGQFFMFGGSDDGAREGASSRQIISIDFENISANSDGPTVAISGVQLPTPDNGTGWMGHTATLIGGDSERSGQVLIVGGSPHILSGNGGRLLGQTNATNAVFRFDPANDTLHDTSTLAHRRFGHTATANHRGEIVVAGGFAQHETSLQMAEFIEVYDPDSDQWSTRTGTLSAGSVFHGAARLGERGVLVCGGINAQFEYTDTCQLITPTGGLETKEPLPTSLVWPTMVTLESGSILLTGGLDTSASAFENFWAANLSSSNRAWIFDGDTWTETEPMRTARAMHSASVLPGGRVVVAGGVTGVDPDADRIGMGFSGLLFDHASAIACVEIFDPETQTFESVEACSSETGAATLPERTLLPSMATDSHYGTLIAGGVGINNGDSVDGLIVFQPSFSAE